MRVYDLFGATLTEKKTMADKQMEKLELHTDSVKAAAESMGINNLSDDAASLLSEDTTYRIKQVRVYVGFGHTKTHSHT